jgi:hypothetical protein
VDVAESPRRGAYRPWAELLKRPFGFDVLTCVPQRKDEAARACRGKSRRMPRFEKTSPARPDRKSVNPFSNAPRPLLQGRPAAVDFLELHLDGQRVWRLRGAALADSGEPLYEAQWRQLRYATPSRAENAFSKQLDGARSDGFREVAEMMKDKSRPSPRILDPRKETASSFVTGLASVPWFVNVGLDSDEDASVARIRSFDEWGGPEDLTGALLHERLERWSDVLTAMPSDSEWPALEARVQDLVTTRGSWNVPFDPDEDPLWHPPTACVGFASFVSGLLTCHLRSQKPIPDELAEMWSWFARGHWPAAYDESSDLEQGKLIVF